MSNSPPPPAAIGETAGAVATSLEWTSELTKRFWNYHSQFPQAYFAEQYGGAILDTALPFLGGATRVLDYACGAGALTGKLLHRGLTVAACDLSPDSLAAVAKVHGGKAGFMGAMQIHNVGQAGPFDAAFLVELVEHVDDSTLRTIFADVRGALRPGGWIVITTPNDEDLLAETVYCPCCKHTFHRWQHVRSWSSDSLGEFLREQGFEPTAMLTTDLSLTTRDGYLRFLGKRLARRLLRRKSPHLIAVATLRKPVIGARR